MRQVAVVSYHLACASTLIALAVLSLLPRDNVPRTELGGHWDHILAYASTALLFAISAHRRSWPIILLALIAYAGVLEVLQSFVPGRTSQIGDFSYSAVGVITGFIVVRLIQLVARSGAKDAHNAKSISSRCNSME
jgi:VanZ family protein